MDSSPNRIILSRHSDFTDRTQRSVWGFKPVLPRPPQAPCFVLTLLWSPRLLREPHCVGELGSLGPFRESMRAFAPSSRPAEALSE
jgi:hypothetical protein